MYTLSNRLRLFSIILVVVGLIGLVAGFVTTPSSIEEVKEMMASHDDHGEAHDNKAVAETQSHTGNTVHAEATIDKDAHGGDAHYEHILHQLQNKPWAALYIAAFFFFMIALGVLAFYAIQFAAQAGWSPVLFRVMEAITAYLVPGGLILFIILALSGFHVNHLFVWADPEVVAHDALIKGKSGWLNGTGFIIRAAIFMGGWILYRHFAVKYSRKQDEDTVGNKWYKKSFKISAGFLVFFIYTESMMSWDWIMSFDPHWFSTLFGWYVFAGLFVSGITTIALMTIYLKSRGYLEFVNNSHIHDLAKFMFGISIFWTYLWFSQFMLIWYSNIPEEVTYFITRIEDYKLPFFGMLIMNFIFPLLILMNSDFKRLNWFVVMAGIMILCGHYIDVFNMVMPATVGTSWFIGLSEISSVLFFLGLFLFVVFGALTKAPLLAKGNPYIKESKHFHY
ncbi:quinol:cytochrome C oxidoreductase [Aquimarina sp. W85]|uniref:quinol:cytochrome C oxidoreductase n=1 Tax=Aquimarina rhodophyticola TaxID=3342246 RepID=UPI003671454A